VRINALDTPHFDADVQAVVQPAVALVNLPKVQRPAEVAAAARALERAEVANGIQRPIRLLLNVETPQALRDAAALAAAHPRVAGLQLGLGDLFEPLGIARRENTAVQQAMFMLRLAAGSAGVFAYDSAYADIADTDGYRAEAALARRLGFLGKSCIHPSQVPLANQAFMPGADEIERARRIVAAAADAAAQGSGAFVVDGRMVDRPFVDSARATLALARRLGLTGG
jgi:citrate lyase subunit beta / citryl-CoA lyase